MRRLYFCLNCRTQIGYGHRFCSNCGAKLQWTGQHVMPEPSSLNQHLTSRERNQYRNFQSQDNRIVDRQRHTLPADRVKTPMRTEIVTLLAELFNKQINYS